MKNFNFNIPTQVIFKEEGDSKWLRGIGFEEVIICGCCGSVFEPEDVEECIELDFWIDLSESIADEGYIENLLLENEDDENI